MHMAIKSLTCNMHTNFHGNNTVKVSRHGCMSVRSMSVEVAHLIVGGTPHSSSDTPHSESSTPHGMCLDCERD